MLQLRLHNAHIALADRIQELPHALGMVTRRTDEGGHHGCTPKVRRVTHSFPVYSFQIQQWLQCLPELVICHGFQPDSTQSHCLPVLFIGQLFVCCLSLPPGSPRCRICCRCFCCCFCCWFFLYGCCCWEQFRRGGWTERGKGKSPQQTSLEESFVGLGPCYMRYLMGASLW